MKKIVVITFLSITVITAVILFLNNPFIKLNDNQTNSKLDSEQEIPEIQETLQEEEQEQILNYGAVKTDIAEIHESPDLESPIIFNLKVGDVFEVISRSSEPQAIYERFDYWYEIQFEGQKGWIYNIFFIKISESLAAEIKNSYSLKANITFDKYKLIKDPYKQQYIKFTDDNNCEYVYNMGEGFYTRTSLYYIRGKYIFIEYPIILRIDTNERLTLVAGADDFTYGNLNNGTQLVLEK